MKKILTLDVVIGIILILFSGWFWVLSNEFPKASQLFPKIFLALTFTLSVFLIINSIRKQMGEEKGGKVIQEEKSFWKKSSLSLKAYCIIIIYVFGIKYIGFFVMTTVFLVGFMYFLNVRKTITLITVTAGVDLFLYLLFSVGLRLSLPAGLLF